MNATTTYELTIDRDELLSALVEFEKLCDSEQHYHAVRVDPTGKVRVTTDPGWNCSQDEYCGRMPHTVTVKRAAGAGQCDLPEDWNNDDGEIDDEQIDECVKKLEEAGYSVTLA